MTTVGYRLLYLVPLITYTFGALTFSVLTWFYWREPRNRRAVAAFTLICLVAFLCNLGLAIAQARDADPWWATAFLSALDVASALLPPVLLQVVYEEEQSGLPVHAFWRTMLVVFYATGAATGIARVLDDAEVIEMTWGGALEHMTALLFGAAGALGLLMQSLSKNRRRSRPGRPRKPSEARQRLPAAVLLCSMPLFAAATFLPQAPPWLSLLPDYVVLGFFCVTLYYKERLIFFDLLIKRGVFFALALIGLTLFFLFVRQPQDWSQPWIVALLLVPFWLMAPWIYGRVERGIDRAWLHRRYSLADAERQFVRDIQPADNQEDLRIRAEASLNEIIQAPATVLLDAATTPPADEDGLAARLELNGKDAGWILLNARNGSIPYMSDDRRLIQSLARTLGVVLESVRFREQQQRREEREQQLLLLTNRAELKALRAQINPHFLFNALNAIAGLIATQPELADETVERLAEVFRYTLRTSDNEWARLEEEIEFVKAYLCVEQARFGDRLSVEFCVSPAANAILIPAMTIQPLIENAVKHGVSALEGCGKVGLRAAVEGAQLCIEVSDNGPGFPQSFALEAGAGGHGLRNVTDRLAGYYGSSARLAWESGHGITRVLLTIPASGAKSA